MFVVTTNSLHPHKTEILHDEDHPSSLALPELQRAIAILSAISVASAKSATNDERVDVFSAVERNIEVGFAQRRFSPPV